MVYKTMTILAGLASAFLPLSLSEEKAITPTPHARSVGQGSNQRSGSGSVGQIYDLSTPNYRMPDVVGEWELRYNLHKDLFGDSKNIDALIDDMKMDPLKEPKVILDERLRKSMLALIAGAATYHFFIKGGSINSKKSIRAHSCHSKGCKSYNPKNNEFLGRNYRGSIRGR